MQCEDILLSKDTFTHPQNSINKELLLPKQPLSHTEQLMEQRATFGHVQSDTREYVLLPNLRTAKEVLLPNLRNNPCIMLCCASGLNINILV